MPTTLLENQVRYLRQRGQRLEQESSGADDRDGGAARIVREVGGLQAQDLGAARLGVRVRSAGLTVEDVDRARNDDRSVVRAWCMRGTVHLVAAEDLRWLLSLLGPAFIQANRRRRAELGLDDETCARGARALAALLADQGPLTRAEIVDGLALQGIQLVGQAAPHLIGYAALKGLICQGPDRGRQPTYVLLDDWVAPEPTPTRDVALSELARRHLAAYGPAGPDDLGAWSGLPKSDVRRAWECIADEVIEVTIRQHPSWMLKVRAAWLDEPPPEHPIVRLLPSFDTYLLGYRSRDLTVEPERTKRINAGGGIINPVLLVDGWVRGTWRSSRQRGKLKIVVDPFEPLPPEVDPGLEAEASDLGRFLGLQTSLQVTSP